MTEKECEKLAELFNKFVNKANTLSDIINVYHSGFVPNGEEAKKFAKQETDTLFQQVKQALWEVKIFLNERVYWEE